MNELWQVIQIILIGIAAILLVIMLKVNDITSTNPNLNFWQVTKLFFSKAQASYFASLIAIIIYAATHEQWVVLVTNPGSDKHGFVEKAVGLVKVMAFFVGGGMQWGMYKFFLKKVDGIMKIWSGEPPAGGPDVTTVQQPIRIDGSLEQKPAEAPKTD